MYLTDIDNVAVLGHPEDRLHSGGDILQDCVSEHSSLTKTESDPQGDLSLPGEPLLRTKKVQIMERRRICILFQMHQLHLLK